LQQVASLINADPKEIIFTSGATESNNTIIKGIARFYKSKKKHIITLQTVPSVLVACELGVSDLFVTSHRSTNAYWIHVDSCSRRVLM